MKIFWKQANWEAEDPHLTQLDLHPFRRDFPQLNPDKGLYIIRGPRQVGKTSWLKTILSAEVRNRGYKNCFYLSCENIQDRRELSELLKGLTSYELIMLDELTYIKDWALPIKHAIDAGDFQTILLTGSNASDLRKGSEQLPGRFGKGGEFHLLPMNFGEFSNMRKMAHWPQFDLDEELELFFKLGGFPAALAEAGPDGKDPAQAMETYKKWLVGDVLKLGKRESYLREIMGQVALTTGAPISLQKLAQKTQIGSHHTALDYIEVLEDCFSLRTLYAIDPDTGSFRFRKNKKFYFTDPLLYRIALDYSGFSAPSEPAAMIAELVANEAIFRRFPKTRFGYFHSQKGEIDFFAPQKWAIEVKWSEIPGNLSRAYLAHRGTWKTVWTKRNFLQEWPDL